MDITSWNYIIAFLFTCFDISTTVIQHIDMTFTEYRKDHNLDGCQCIPDETVFKIGNVSDALQCCKLCQLNEAVCRDVFYQPDFHTCIGCSNRPRTYFILNYPGSQYFRSYEMQEKESSEMQAFERLHGQTEIYGTDCKDVLKRSCGTINNGLYKIRLWESKEILTVYCDMETDGGGWTVFQNRFDGSVDFYRNFSEYEDGFGELKGEFWQGLRFVQEMVAQGKTELRLDFTGADNSAAYETFQNFHLDDSPLYTIHMGPGVGTINHIELIPGSDKNVSFSLYDGSHFSTYDVDQGTHVDNCAVKLHSGWWHQNRCGFRYANLNGMYIEPGTKHEVSAGRAMVYFTFKGYYSLKKTKMMFRRI